MKKIIILLILACLLLGLATTASAETTIYLDTIGNGSYQANGKSIYYSEDGGTLHFKINGDLRGFILGSESSVGKMKMGMEYGKISTNHYNPTENGISDDNNTLHNNFTIAEVKGGFRVIDQEKWKLDFIAAVLDINSDGEWTSDGITLKRETNQGGNMLGADFLIHFSKNFSLQGTLANSFFGSNSGDLLSFRGTEGGDCVDSSLTEIKLKLNYSFTNNFAVALGYRSYQISARYETKSGEGEPLYCKMNEDSSIDILTIGAVYKF
jgi:opacity protein-like surface antigen